MPDEPKPTPEKKPPAHEVILARLQELERRMIAGQDELYIALRSDGKPEQRDYVTTAALHMRLAFLGAIFNELIGVLAMMHLPEKELPRIYHAICRINGARIFPGGDLQRCPWDDLYRMLEQRLGPEQYRAISMMP